MIDRLLEKLIQCLVKWYTSRKKAMVFGNYSLSFDDTDFLYAWVAHNRAQIVYDAMRKALEESRTSAY